MKKDKLEAEARKVEWAVNLADQNGDIDRSLSYDVRYLIECINKLDEPEAEENFYTFDNAKKWLQDNGFVVFEKDKLDEEVQRMIDKNYKEMNEKPVIPQFVADYYNDYKNYELTFEEWFECSEFGKGGKTENKTFEWLLDNSHEVNIERQFILADIIAHGLDGYEVEKEKLYHVVNKENYFMLRKYDGLVDIMQVSSTMSRDEFGKDTRFMLTEQEIKDYDERYWAFAEEVTK